MAQENFELRELIIERFDELERLTLIGVKTMLTAEEACAYMGVTKSHLYNLTSRREIPHHKPQGKALYFDKAELDKWLRRGRVRTQQEAESMAAAHVARHPMKRKGGAR